MSDLTPGFVAGVLTNRPPAVTGSPLAGVVVDSRQARPGDLFVAFVGEHADGHAFVADAFARGARLALVERPVEGEWLTVDARRPVDEETWHRATAAPRLCLLVGNTLTALQSLAKAWRARFRVRVVGVTGSIGKTTTKELIHSVLSQRYRTLKSAGNQNNEIGLPLTLLNLRPEHQRVVLEMGMYAGGEICLLCEVARPQVGVVTNVGPVHLERLGTMEAIVAAKQELVEALPPAPDGVAILNKDDALVMGMAAHTQARVFTYGLDSQADLWADNVKSMGLSGIRLSLHHGQQALSLRVPLLGLHSVHTVLRAAAVGLAEGLSWEEIVAGLQTQGDQLRLIVTRGPHGALILDDTYNSSPDSAVAALNLLADLEGRRIAVLGDMLELGAVEEAGHRLVGRRALDVAHVLVAVGPRGRLIGEEALAAGMPAERVLWAAEAEAAIPLLHDLIQANDVILVKGSRGARLDRIVEALSKTI
ncbi:MAG: UDP-N-acetylmuramoyl-tripeptide--D-alanyl-D-alanine ligase [Chloroflexota bacterium]